MSHVDVSELAECGATGLLAAQVRACLEQYGRDGTLSDIQRRQVASARKYVSDALEGLQELMSFRDTLRFAGDKLDAVLTFRSASRALREGPETSLDRSELMRLQERLEEICTHLGKLLSGELDAASREKTDKFFDAISEHCVAERERIVGTASEPLA